MSCLGLCALGRGWIPELGSAIIRIVQDSRSAAPSPCPVKVCVHSPVVAFQSLAATSAEAVKRQHHLLKRISAELATPPCPAKVRAHSPLAGFQSLAVRSSDSFKTAARKHCRIDIVSMSCQGLRAPSRGWTPEPGSAISRIGQNSSLLHYRQ